ncbi:hypothetical protein ACIGW8_17750 [Streptomyces sioyaensis]|uniref:hypothetical protein n=1 Tax=Streptomyces sioyaensis TaxID=67364 RepID=UPI0037D718F6
MGLLISGVRGWATWGEPVTVDTPNTAGLALMVHTLTVATTAVGVLVAILLLLPRVFPGLLAVLLFLAGVAQIFNWQVSRELSGGILYCVLAVCCVVAAVASLLVPGQLADRPARNSAR